MSDDDRIAPTAHYTAYVWKHLGLPYADLYATPKGAALFWGFRFAGEGLLALTPSLPTMAQYLEVRHRTIDAALEDEAPDLVIEIGAGFSRRGTTWAADKKIEYVEVDLPHQTAIKARLIEERGGTTLRVRLGGRLRLESADVLAPDFGARLRAWLGNGRRSAIVAEGLLGYFSISDRRKLVGAVASALRDSGGGIFVSEMRLGGRGTGMKGAVRAMRGAIRLLTAGRGTGPEFATRETARAFLVDAGFDEVDEVPRSRLPALQSIPVPNAIFVSRVAPRSGS